MGEVGDFFGSKRVGVVYRVVDVICRVYLFVWYVFSYCGCRVNCLF